MALHSSWEVTWGEEGWGCEQGGGVRRGGGVSRVVPGDSSATYLLVIKFIVCTQPDHHTEAEPLVHCTAPGSTLCGRVRDAAPSHSH